jgi:hypothetical protein
MPVVFVHGVNNRKENPDYEPRRLVTERFLLKYLSGATINGKRLDDFRAIFPYWGDLATRFAWGMKSLPSGSIDALGVAGLEARLRPIVALVGDAVAVPGQAKDEPLTALAQKSFTLAVEVLCELALQDATAADASAAATFVVEVQMYATTYAPPANPPAWIRGVTTDEQFVGQLLAAVRARAAASEADVLGVIDSIANAVATAAAKLKQATRGAAGKVLDRAGDFASTKMLAWSRAPLNATLGRFFGDVFVYMNSRGVRERPGDIPRRILDDWDRARAAAPQEPFVLVGHSLGGVISFDLVSHFRPDVIIDLFVTVGSQVSHFEEMKLFRVSDVAIPNTATPRVPKPGNIKHWINVLDEVDIFSYACSEVFENVHDLRYDTQTYTIKAHGAYLEQARFYERLRARIDELPAL